MGQSGLDSILIILLIICIVVLIVVLYKIYISSNNNREEGRVLKELDKMRKKLEVADIPIELVEIILALYKRILDIEQSKIEQAKTFLALMEGFDKKIKDVQDASRMSELKVNAVLANLMDRQKEILSLVKDQQLDDVLDRLKRTMAQKKPLASGQDLDEYLDSLMKKPKKDQDAEEEG